tara:strand:- start:20572 stop:20847 length:276 start_codon:yes stop_codon:yes gene_type:complete
VQVAVEEECAVAVAVALQATRVRIQRKLAILQADAGYAESVEDRVATLMQCALEVVQSRREYGIPMADASVPKADVAAFHSVQRVLHQCAA